MCVYGFGVYGGITKWWAGKYATYGEDLSLSEEEKRRVVLESDGRADGTIEGSGMGDGMMD